MKIKIFNIKNSQYEEEKVYGESFIDFLYKNPIGRLASPILTHKSASKLYGSRMDSPRSRKKISSFIEDFDIAKDDFIQSSTCDVGWNNFNEFFIRQYKPEVLNFVQGGQMPAFSDGRYFAWADESDVGKLPVKGYQIDIHELLGRNHTATFKGGPVVVSRLAPIDYHRYHFPDDAKIVESYQIPGVLHSVNPLALKSKSDIFMVNERVVTILDSKNFGRLAMIEVGAVCVGKIVQTYTGPEVKRGSEKGFFKFGGSTVILLGEQNAWRPRQEILDHTSRGIECLIKLGDTIAGEGE